MSATPDYQRLQRLAEGGDKDAALELARFAERRGDWLGQLQALLWRERARPIQKSIDTAVSERFWSKKLLPHLMDFPQSEAHTIAEALGSVEHFVLTTPWFDRTSMKLPKTWADELAFGEDNTFAALCSYVEIPGALKRADFARLCRHLGTNIHVLKLRGRSDLEPLLAWTNLSQLRKFYLRNATVQTHFRALLRKLERCRHLKTLQLRACGLHDGMFHDLMYAKLPKLEVLDVSWNADIGNTSAGDLLDEGGVIAERVSKLSRLLMTGCGFSHSGVARDLLDLVQLANGSAIELGRIEDYDYNYDDDYE